jgi:probable HAF family extracellular repeat protein
VWTKKRAFILTAQPPTIPLTGNAVNDRGQVAGHLVGDDPFRTAGFVWTRGHFAEIGDLPGGFTLSTALGINQSGQVVGYSLSAQGHECVFWENGNLMSLGDLPGGNVDCTAFAINRSGVVVGVGRTDEGFRPFFWREGTMTELPLPPEATSGGASEINRFGVVLGSFSGPSSAGPIVWSNDGMTLLPGLPGLGANAIGINDRGDIVGSVGDGRDPARAVLWRDGVLMILNDLIADEDPLKSCTRLEGAKAINNHGEIAASGADVCIEPVSNAYIYRLVPVKAKRR